MTLQILSREEVLEAVERELRELIAEYLRRLSIAVRDNDQKAVRKLWNSQLSVITADVLNQIVDSE